LWKAQTNGQANGKLSKDQLSKYTPDLHNLLAPTTTSYLHEEKAYFSVYGKQRGLFSGKICVILLPQACVCVCAHACVCLLHGYVQPVRIPQQHSLTCKLQKQFQDSFLSISRAPSSSGANHGSKPTLPIESSDII